MISSFGVLSVCIALRSGFRSVRNTLGGMKCISSYLFDLSQYLYHKMTSLVHDSTGDSTGDPLCIIYGHHHEHNILKQGRSLDFVAVDTAQWYAVLARLYLRL